MAAETLDAMRKELVLQVLMRGYTSFEKNKGFDFSRDTQKACK